jgi:hypothetical protein
MVVIVPVRYHCQFSEAVYNMLRKQNLYTSG